MSSLLESDVYSSVDDYIQGELVSEKRHEYAGGRVCGMAGARNVHNIIAGNIFAALHTHLEGKPCVAYVSDMIVKIRAGREELFIIRM